MKRTVGMGVAAVALLALGGCGGVENTPPANPGSPNTQPVPQMTSGDGNARTDTYCLVPPGTQLRVFASRDGHGRQIASVVDVSRLPAGNPYRCP